SSPTYTGPADDFSGLYPGFTFVSPDNAQGPYQTFVSQNEYVYESGLSQQAVGAAPSPVGVPPVRCRLVQLHAPIGRRVYTWAVERLGQKPTLPHPESDDPNEVLAEAHVFPRAPELNATATAHVFYAEGVYTYYLLEPFLHLGT